MSGARVVSTVSVEVGTRLHRVFRSERFKVNSLHHQAIDRLGEGLQAVARDLDDLVQAVESPADGPFWVGVQWHPEYLFYHRRQRRLFEALVARARECTS